MHLKKSFNLHKYTLPWHINWHNVQWIITSHPSLILLHMGMGNKQYTYDGLNLNWARSTFDQEYYLGEWVIQISNADPVSTLRTNLNNTLYFQQCIIHNSMQSSTYLKLTNKRTKTMIHFIRNTMPHKSTFKELMSS